MGGSWKYTPTKITHYVYYTVPASYSRPHFKLSPTDLNFGPHLPGHLPVTQLRHTQYPS